MFAINCYVVFRIHSVQIWCLFYSILRFVNIRNMYVFSTGLETPGGWEDIFERLFSGYLIVIFVRTVLPSENISSWSNNKPFERKLCNSIWIFFVFRHSVERKRKKERKKERKSVWNFCILYLLFFFLLKRNGQLRWCTYFVYSTLVMKLQWKPLIVITG